MRSYLHICRCKTCVGREQAKFELLQNSALNAKAPLLMVIAHDDRAHLVGQQLLGNAAEGVEGAFETREKHCPSGRARLVIGC
jgi:hypothetical protein